MSRWIIALGVTCASLLLLQVGSLTLPLGLLMSVALTTMVLGGAAMLLSSDAGKQLQPVRVRSRRR